MNTNYTVKFIKTTPPSAVSNLPPFFSLKSNKTNELLNETIEGKKSSKEFLTKKTLNLSKETDLTIFPH